MLYHLFFKFFCSQFDIFFISVQVLVVPLSFDKFETFFLLVETWKQKIKFVNLTSQASEKTSIVNNDVRGFYDFADAKLCRIMWNFALHKVLYRKTLQNSASKSAKLCRNLHQTLHNFQDKCKKMQNFVKLCTSIKSRSSLRLRY